MKKYLGVITTIGLVATAGSTVIACNTKKNDSPAKIALEKLINQVALVIKDYKGKHDSVEFSNLNAALNSARSCHYSSDSKDSDYLESSINLVEALKEFQNPGYKEARNSLVQLLNHVIDYVSENSDPKTPEVIANLKKAIRETWEVLDNEVKPVIIRLAHINLEFHFDKYWQNKGE